MKEKFKMICIDATPIYDENKCLKVQEGYICCYGCILYKEDESCSLVGKLKSPVKVKCSEFESIFE